jgi:hypothetical protein
MCLLLSRGLSKVGTRGLHRARRGSAANHEIICRTHRRPENRTKCAESPWHRYSVPHSLLLLRLLPTNGARIKMPFSPRRTKRPSEFQVRSPATLVASGFCKALTHCPCFEHRHDPLCSSSALRRDGDEDAEVFLLRTAPRYRWRCPVECRF